MREVAAAAKVSIKTVSRVVNGERGVTPRLSARVAAAVERVGYRHNLTASSLRRTDGRSASIGVVLEDVANPFSSALHRSIEDVAVARGVLVFAGSSDEDGDRERELIAAFTSRRVDGLIILPSSLDHSYLNMERQVGTAIVFVDRPPSAADRHRGYAEEVVARKLDMDDRLVRLGVRGTESAEAAVSELFALQEPPTALFTGQNLITIGACRALRRLGLHRKIALVGFDDILLADLLEPGITVIAQDPAAMGRIAAELLFRRLDGDRSASAQHVVPTKMITRGSGEIRP